MPAGDQGETGGEGMMEKVDMGVRDLLALYDARIHGESMQNTIEMLEYIRRVKSKEPLRQEVNVYED